jgi:hypothetical protein
MPSLSRDCNRYKVLTREQDMRSGTRNLPLSLDPPLHQENWAETPQGAPTRPYLEKDQGLDNHSENQVHGTGNLLVEEQVHSFVFPRVIFRGSHGTDTKYRTPLFRAETSGSSELQPRPRNNSRVFDCRVWCSHSLGPGDPRPSGRRSMPIIGTVLRELTVCDMPSICGLC